MRSIKKFLFGCSLFILVVSASKNVISKPFSLTAWSQSWNESDIIRL